MDVNEMPEKAVPGEACGLNAGLDTAPGAEVAEVLEGRAAFYEMLASLFFKPLTQDQVDAMAVQDFSPYQGINDAFDEGINHVTRYLRKRHTGTRQELACDFTSAFAGTKTYEGKSAVPYESVFTSEEGLLCQGSYHEVCATSPP